MNTAELRGRVTKVGLWYEYHGEKFYLVLLSIKRLSNLCDEIHVMVSEKLVKDISDISVGSDIFVIGQYRSHFNNERVEGKGRLVLYVFAFELGILDKGMESDIDIIEAEGVIRKPPIIRETPLGRVISDVLLLVYRGGNYNRSDYIPCIFWGRNARYVSNMEVGTKIHIIGRVQSRKYMKEDKERTAYEVSVSEVSKIIEDY